MAKQAAVASLLAMLLGGGLSLVCAVNEKKEK